MARLNGTRGAETLAGGDGNDRIFGRGGADTLTGGDGDDWIFFDTAEQMLAPGRLVDGGAGRDGLLLRFAATLGDEAFAGMAGLERIDLHGSGAASLTLATHAAAAFGPRLMVDARPAVTSLLVDGGALGAGITLDLRGTAGADTLRGGAGGDRILGRGGWDRLEGGAGNDTLRGAGTLDGGAGNDVLDLDQPLDSLAPGRSLIGGEGTDTLRLWHPATLRDADFAGISGIEILRLNGAGPARLVLGENAAAAFADGLRLTLGAAAESLSLDASGIGNVALNVSGGRGADLIRGGAGRDLLTGGDGADTLQGGGGNDTLRGGAGTDLVRVEGPRGDYQLVTVANGLQLRHLPSGERDLLQGVERLLFADGTLVLLAPNEAPVARDDVALVEDGAARLDILANDGDADGDALRVAAVEGQPGTTVVGRFGTLTWSEGGAAEFVVDPASADLAALAVGELGEESFRVTIADALGAQADSTLSFTMLGVNDAPVARDGTMTLRAGNNAMVRLVADDVDSDDHADTLDYRFLDQPSPEQGSLSLASAGHVSFAAGSAYAGLLTTETATLTLRWQAVDQHGAESDIRTLTITVTGRVPPAPVITGIAEDGGAPGDGVTNDATPSILGTAPPDAAIEVFRDGTLLGATQADATGAWSFAATLPAEGVHVLTAVATLDGVPSAASLAFEVTLDSTAPVFDVALAAPQPLDTAPDSIRLLARDLDGDGLADLVSAFADGTVRAYINEGGTLRDSFRGSAPALVELRLGDMDGDGSTDLVLSTDGRLVVRLGDGEGGFGAERLVPTRGPARYFDLGDMDRDGRLDIVVQTQDPVNPVVDGWKQDRLDILLNDGNAGFGLLESYFTPDFAWDGGLRVADIGGSTAPDVWLLRHATVRLHNAGDGTMLLEDDVTSAKMTTELYTNAFAKRFTLAEDKSFELADFDGDGVIDRVMLNYMLWSDTSYATNAQVAIFNSKGITQVGEANGFNRDVGAMTVGDLNGDGRPDIAYAVDRGPQFVIIAINDGTGGFNDLRAIPLGASSEWSQRVLSLAIADMDGDGRADIVAGLQDSTLGVIRNTSTGLLGIGTDTGLSASDAITQAPVTTLRGFAEAGSQVTLTREGVAIGTALADAETGAFVVTLATALGEGRHALRVEARDAAGNLSLPSAPFMVVVDTTADAPVIQAITPDVGRSGTDLVTGRAPREVIGTAEGGARVELLVDGALVSADTARPDGRFTLAARDAVAAEGTYSVQVRMTDLAGNQALSAPVTVTVDHTPPAAPVLRGIGPDTGPAADDALTAEAITTVTGTAEAGSLVTLHIGRPYLERVQQQILGPNGLPVDDNGRPLGFETVTVTSGFTAIGTAIADESGAFTVTLAAPLAATGLRHLTATATDAAGNVSARSAALQPGRDDVAPSFAPGFGPGVVPGGSVALPAAVNHVTLGDFDGDGHLDLLAGTAGEGVRILHGNGTGLFEAPARGGFPGGDARQVLLLDADGDGRMDILAGGEIGGARQVLLHRQVEPGLLSPVAEGFYGSLVPVAADVTGDGRADLLATSTADQPMAVFLAAAQPAGGLGSLVRLAGAADFVGADFTVGEDALSPLAGLRGAAVADVTGDGLADIVLGIDGTVQFADSFLSVSSYVNVLRGQGDGSFLAPVSTLVGDGLAAFALGDLDGDGRADLVTVETNLLTTGTPSLAIRFAGADGRFLDAGGTALAAPPAALVLGDADGDGDLDILLAQGADGLAWMRNDGLGGFSTPMSIAGVAEARSVAVADVTGDGRPDLLIGGATGVTLLAGGMPGLTGVAAVGDALALVGQAEPGASVALFRDGAAAGTALADAQGRFAVTLAAPLDPGSHAFHLVVTDRAGNASAPSPVFSVTVGAELGVPAITAVFADADPADVGGATRGPVTRVEGSADAGSHVQILSAGEVLGGVQAGADGRFVLVLEAPLTAEGAYTLVARASDLGGRSAEAAPLPVVIDRTAPDAPAGLGIGPADTGASATDAVTQANVTTLTGTAEAGSLVTLHLGLARPVPGGGVDAPALLATVHADADGRFSATLDTPLAGDGRWVVTATATDAAGNVSSFAAPLTITVDRRAPEVGTGLGTAVPLRFADPVRDMLLADLDGDGVADLAVAGDGGLEIRFGDGDGRFGPGAVLLPEVALRSLAAGDLDGDGLADLVAATMDGALLAYRGRAGEVPAVAEALPGSATRVMLADLSGDSVVDLLTIGAAPGGGEALTLRTADGAGGFGAARTLATAATLREVLVADLGNPDSNGSLDLETGEFTPDPVLPDGVPDIALLDGSGQATVLWGRLNSMSGWFAEGGAVAGRFAGAVALTHGDLNGGAPDLVVARGDAASVQVVLSDDIGGYRAPVTVALPGTPTAVALGDVTGDGAADLVVALAALDEVAVLAGDGAGGFGAAMRHAAGDNPSALWLADVDGDGRSDILVRGDDGLLLLLGRPEGLTGLVAQAGGTAAAGRVEDGAAVTIYGQGVALGSGFADAETGEFFIPLSSVPVLRVFELGVTDLAGNTTLTPFDFSMGSVIGGGTVDLFG